VAEYDIPDDLRYTEQDEWARLEDGRVLVGITDYAQQKLGDIVFVDLPAPKTRIDQGSVFGAIESVKAVSELYAPVSGRVIERNEELAERPEMVNEDCYGDGWFLTVALEDEEEYESLLDATAYRKFLEEREE